MTTIKPRNAGSPPPSVIRTRPEEVQEYTDTVKKFRAGDMADDAFMSFRVRLGVYGQRQPDSQMMRIKLPGGLAHADQLDAIAEIVERFAPLKKGHITTRENIQIHHLKLEDATQAMYILDKVGLSTKEACGNTVRNVTACPMVGVDPRQAFDIQPYLGAYVRNFVRRDFTFHMPRKIKSAFSCGDHDCAQTTMHDVGMIGRVREFDGVQRKGFKIVIGGGTSIQPLKAQTLYEFVPVEDYLKVMEAVLRVYNRTAWLRKSKMKARIKVLIHTEGMDSFRKNVEKELQEDWAKDFASRDGLLFFDEERADIPALPGAVEARGQRDAAFKLWRKTNVVPQTVEGYSLVSVTVPQGDLTPDQFRGIGTIARTYASFRVRMTPEQNLMYRWVPTALVYDVYEQLRSLGLAGGGLNQITDVTSCPGTDSCKLGITSSMGLNRAISGALRDPLQAESKLLDDPLIQKMHIKASGCPNGCSRHHLADIGFHGAFIKGPNGGQVPAYELFVGGSYEEGDLRYGLRPRGRVPAKRAPEAISRILKMYKDTRQEGELFRDFAARMGREAFESLLADMDKVGPLNKESLDLYMDYDKTVLYKMERGEGECGV